MRSRFGRASALALAACLCLACPSKPKTSSKSTKPINRSSTAAAVRSPRFFAPKGEGPTDTKRPLLIALHGLGGSGQSFERALDLRGFATSQKIVVAAPDGTLDRRGRRFWNASDACCNFESLQVDDVGFIEQLIEQAVSEQGVDPSRVFVLGYSNGGFMAHRLGCEIGSQLQGIASIAGAGSSLPCEQAGLSVLELHGDQDRIVHYTGGHVLDDERQAAHPSALQTQKAWAHRQGCSTEPRPASSLDLSPALPGAETTVMSFDNCLRGAVELWTLHGVGHRVPLGRSVLSAIWAFWTRA